MPLIEAELVRPVALAGGRTPVRVVARGVGILRVGDVRKIVLGTFADVVFVTTPSECTSQNAMDIQSRSDRLGVGPASGSAGAGAGLKRPPRESQGASHFAMHLEVRACIEVRFGSSRRLLACIVLAAPSPVPVTIYVTTPIPILPIPQPELGVAVHLRPQKGST